MITQENIPYTADEIKAMVKTIEELRKKYNEVLERAKRMMSQKEIEYLFPELKVTESEDDKIKKEILEVATKVVQRAGTLYGVKYDCQKWIAWLEKQGKTLNADEVIAWLVANIIDYEDMVKLFKKDFGL